MSLNGRLDNGWVSVGMEAIVVTVNPVDAVISLLVDTDKYRVLPMTVAMLTI